MSVALALLLAGERLAVGAWERWGAFRDASPRRCFAVAQPVGPSGGTDRRGGFASVTARGSAGGTLFLRFSVARRAAAPITLAIGERRFALIGDAHAARAPDAATDRAIVGAMRGGRSMSLSSVALSGAPFADTYALSGAATAIDAAALACAG